MEPTSTILYLAICFAMISSGTTSLFGIYGTDFSELLGFTTYRITFLTTILEYSYHLSAPVFGYLSIKIGPKKEFFLKNQRTSFFISTWLIFFIGSGSKAVYMSCLSTAAFLYSKSNYIGVALSIPISMSGLSSFVFANIKSFFFESETTHIGFLLFLGLFNGLSIFLMSMFFLKGPLKEKVINKSLLPIKKAQGSSISQNTYIETPNSYQLNISSNNTEKIVNSKNNNVGTKSHPNSPKLFSAPISKTKLLKIFSKFLSYEFLSSPSFWVFLVGLIFCSGPGIMFINNSGLIAKALSVSTSNTKVLEIELLKNDIVAMFALCSFLGRIMSGFVSDFFRIYFKVPTTFFLLITSFLMFKAQISLGSLIDSNSIIQLSSFIGFSLGLLFSLAPKLATELWGHKSFGISWGILSIGAAVGSHIYNIALAKTWDYWIYSQSNSALNSSSENIITKSTTPALQCDYNCVKIVSTYTSQAALISVLCFFILLLLRAYKK
ncbi:hypothetical protein BB561_001018 [Smittium simulii]|uniref:Probable transporter MCH1 n=1 Tax=Smittium simulii TaxID=133385 RepID=A0A2T9YWH3_9FUNG|nr:hypothetical protein BB561_001018 [Smittium simulii]